jgi:hypothetical protein
MTTNQKSISVPMSVRDVDECNNYFLTIKSDLYEKFVNFWTRHQRFTRTCDPVTCSKVFIVDGHQKANRLICQYKDVFDNTIPELGSVQMGCLYSPLRKGKLFILLNAQSSPINDGTFWRKLLENNFWQKIANMKN